MLFNIFRKFALFLQKIVNHFPLIEYFERRAISNTIDRNSVVPVFIIGAPRTGSTILYQTLLSCYNFSFFSNLSVLFYKSPALINKILSKFNCSYNPQNFKSSYGYTQGVCSPSEAGQIIDYWFGKNLKDLLFNELSLDEVIATIYTIQETNHAPVLIKNLNLSFKIADLQKIFPKAIFIHIKRSPIYTAQSIYVARNKINHDVNRWWSISVPGKHDFEKLPPFLQIMNQIKVTDEYIEEHINKNKELNYIVVSYEEFIADYEKLLSKIVKFINKKYTLEPRKKSNHKNNIMMNLSNKKRLPELEWNKLKKAYHKIYKD